MPRSVVSKIRSRFSRRGKVRHNRELLNDKDYTIVRRFQWVLQGLYNYYCMAVNVSNGNRMTRAKWVLETSLVKTLARKHQCHVSDIRKKHRVEILGLKALQAVEERPGKKPLVATFGGISFKRRPEGMGTADFSFTLAWNLPASQRSEVVQRLLAENCELCKRKDVPVQVHHVRKLADLDKPGRRPKALWQQIMSARKRKTLVVCEDCHREIHAGEYDGPEF
jgi:hypothetical protein